MDDAGLYGRLGGRAVLSWIVNSLTLVALGLFGQTFVSILVAFGFARTQLPGRNQLFIVVLAT